MKITKFTVTAKRGVNVGKYENFDFGLTLEVEPDTETKVSEQIVKAQQNARSLIEGEVNRLIADLELPRLPAPQS